eukprot:g9373.t1
MEYERALFRVYDKSMEGFHSAAVRSACNLLKKCFLVIGAGLFAALVLLHHQFVNNPGCLAPLLEEAALRERVLIPADPTPLPKTFAGTVTANNTVGEINTSAGAVIVDTGNGNGGGDNKKNDEDEDENHPTKILLPSGSWLPYDVMIGVSIGGQGGGGSRRWWGLRGAAVDGKQGQGGDGKGAHGRRTEDHEGGSVEGYGAEEEDKEEEEEGESGGGEESGADTGAGAAPAAAKTGRDNSTSTGAVNGTGFHADYTFAFEPIVLLLPDKIQGSHNFTWVNFTIEPSTCLRDAGFVSRLLAATVVGYDEIMVNMFMFSMRSKGLLKNTQTGGEWMWSMDSQPASGMVRFFSTVGFKCQVLVRSLMAFVLMSTVTAMTVRTLLSSGVVIMFPMVMLMERMGLQGVDMHQMLALSYPWLGMPIEHLRNQNKPIAPFIMGHLMQMVVFYTVYNACLLAWSYWLYGKTMATSLQVWLYGMVMLYEYFALIFVRARSSIVFFSRTAALSFVAFHVYFYHFQMGYFGLAAWSGFFGMFAVKLYVLQAIELPAYTSGEISHDNPRAHFVELPWPTWAAALPPMWSLFIPPNASSVGVYGDDVPDRPDGGPDGEGVAPAEASIGTAGAGAAASAATGGASGGGGGGGGRGGHGEGEEHSIPPARGAGERGGARARGRGRARARGGARTEQERPLVGGGDRDGEDAGGEEIEMIAPRRRRGTGGFEAVATEEA